MLLLNLAPVVRDLEGYENMDIIIYQPFVNEIKALIQKKQFQAIKLINTETINLYWEIGEEIYCQQEEKGW